MPSKLTRHRISFNARSGMPRCGQAGDRGPFRGAELGGRLASRGLSKNDIIRLRRAFSLTFRAGLYPLSGRRRADRQPSDPLAPPAGRRRRFLFRECRIGATMAPGAVGGAGRAQRPTGSPCATPRSRPHRDVRESDLLSTFLAQAFDIRRLNPVGGRLLLINRHHDGSMTPGGTFPQRLSFADLRVGCRGG
jgi:hypothetical protein